MTANRIHALVVCALMAGSSLVAAPAPLHISPAWIAAIDLPHPAEGALRNLKAIDLDGQQWTPAEMRGRVVLLDFWATWCAPCLKDVPTYQRLRREHDASQLEIIGVSVDVLDRRGLVSWLNRQQVTWTQIHDRRGYSGELAQQFKVVSLPTTYVFDANGKMIAANVRGERLLQTVAALLSTRSPAP
jgi:thiol-disulfide isomerase/thioredoxin